MKFLFISIFLAIGLNSIAQNETAISIENSEFTCDKVEFDSEHNQVILLGNVNFKTDLIKLDGAEKVVYSKETYEILVSGLQEFIFDGTIELDKFSEKKTLRYVIWESIAYVE